MYGVGVAMVVGRAVDEWWRVSVGVVFDEDAVVCKAMGEWWVRVYRMMCPCWVERSSSVVTCWSLERAETKCGG